MSSLLQVNFGELILQQLIFNLPCVDCFESRPFYPVVFVNFRELGGQVLNVLDFLVQSLLFEICNRDILWRVISFKSELKLVQQAD